MQKDLNIQNLNYSTQASVIDNYYYFEAIQHLAVIRNFFENEYGPDNVLTAEANLAFGLVALKTNDIGTCIDSLQKAVMIF